MTEVDRSKKRRRWMAIGLVASLTLNAFFVGAAATDFLRDGGAHDHGGPRMLQFELHWLAGRLPAAAMKQIDAAVAGARPVAEGHIDKIRGLRRQLGRLAAAPQPDRAAIDATLAAMRGEVDQMLAEVQKTTIDALIGMPPDVRAKLAEDDRDPKPQAN